LSTDHLPLGRKLRENAPVSASEERVARNEALFREFNERVALTRTTPEQVRSDPRRFVVAPGHEDTEIERVVARLEGYTVVEKIAEAAEVAIEHDPRS
jgi:hypothetical protein